MEESRPGAGERPLTSSLVTALGLSPGPATVLGLARFGYALLLPPMRSWLRWSFATAGVMNTVNAVGYLVGALGAAWMGCRFGATGMLASATVLAFDPLSGNLPGHAARESTVGTITGRV